MMLKKLLFFLGFLQAVIGQQRRIFVDTVSCSNRRTFVAIEESYHSAIRRAGLAIEALRPWAEGGAPINTFDGRIRNVFDLLFGAQNTRGNLLLVFSHLDRLPGIQYMGGDSTSRTMHDIEIHCNVDYIQPHNHPKEPNIHNWDTVQKRDVRDEDEILDLFSPWKPAFAVTSPVHPPGGRGWDEDAPEVIAFSPSKLYLTAALHGFPGNDVAFGGVRINQASVKAAANPRMHRWLFTHFGGWFERLRVTQIDLLDRLESSMLHELTHTTAGRLADDIELPNSYGWENCRRLQTHRNADNIALFALAVELINKYHYDVNAAGELTKFE